MRETEKGSNREIYEKIYNIIEKYGYTNTVKITQEMITEEGIDRIRGELLSAAETDCYFVHFDDAAKYLIESDSSFKSAFACLTDDEWDGISSVTLANALKRSEKIEDIENEDWDIL